MAFSPRDFPMIDGLSLLDLRREHVEASRSFSRQKDLWIADHRPLKSLAHPLVSAIMMLETFMESARILYPHLQVRGVRQVRFMDMISCPPEVPRSSRISCRRTGADPREVVCEVSLSVEEISPRAGGPNASSRTARDRCSSVTGMENSPGDSRFSCPSR